MELRCNRGRVKAEGGEWEGVMVSCYIAPRSREESLSKLDSLRDSHV